MNIHKRLSALKQKILDLFDTRFPAEHRGYVPRDCCPVCWTSIMNGRRYEETYCGRNGLKKKGKGSAC